MRKRSRTLGFSLHAATQRRRGRVVCPASALLKRCCTDLLEILPSLPAGGLCLPAATLHTTSSPVLVRSYALSSHRQRARAQDC
jgi:hypothetical protein